MNEARFILARDNGMAEEPSYATPSSLDDAFDEAEYFWLTSSAIRILVYEVTDSGAHNLVATRGFQGWECVPPITPPSTAFEAGYRSVTARHPHLAEYGQDDRDRIGTFATDAAVIAAAHALGVA